MVVHQQTRFSPASRLHSILPCSWITEGSLGHWLTIYSRRGKRTEMFNTVEKFFSHVWQRNGQIPEHVECDRLILTVGTFQCTFQLSSKDLCEEKNDRWRPASRSWRLTNETTIVIQETSIPTGSCSFFLGQLFFFLLIDDDRFRFLLDLIDIFVKALQKITKEFLRILFSKSMRTPSFFTVLATNGDTHE